MTMPDFVREAIIAQGKYAVEEIEGQLEDLEPEEDVLLGVLEPEEPGEQEVLDLGSVEPAEHA